jgi:hypothetical protein
MDSEEGEHVPALEFLLSQVSTLFAWMKIASMAGKVFWYPQSLFRLPELPCGDCSLGKIMELCRSAYFWFSEVGKKNLPVVRNNTWRRRVIDGCHVCLDTELWSVYKKLSQEL